MLPQPLGTYITLDALRPLMKPTKRRTRSDENEGSQDKLILQVIESYLTELTPQYIISGRAALLNKIRNLIKKAGLFEIIIPAFPMKSLSLDKVLGPNADLADLLGLMRLEALARDISKIYSKVRIIIISDGVVYQDLVGVTKENVLQYNKDVRALASAYCLEHLEFCSVAFLLQKMSLIGQSEVLGFSKVRERMLTLVPDDFDVSQQILEDSNFAKVYCGFYRFLLEDLKYQPIMTSCSCKRQRMFTAKKIARQMLVRTESLTRLINLACGEAVRLSIHGHNNQGPKYAINLLPFGKSDYLRTPWHNVIALRIDGSIQVCRHADIDPDKFSLVKQNGKPWCYRERDQIQP